jgi:hypothetical protein
MNNNHAISKISFDPSQLTTCEKEGHVQTSKQEGRFTIPGTVVPGCGGTDGFAWMSNTIPPMITGLGSASAALNGFCAAKRDGLSEIGEYGRVRRGQSGNVGWQYVVS